MRLTTVPGVYGGKCLIRNTANQFVCPCFTLSLSWLSINRCVPDVLPELMSRQKPIMSLDKHPQLLTLWQSHTPCLTGHCKAMLHL